MKTNSVEQALQILRERALGNPAPYPLLSMEQKDGIEEQLDGGYIDFIDDLLYTLRREIPVVVYHTDQLYELLRFEPNLCIVPVCSNGDYDYFSCFAVSLKKESTSGVCGYEHERRYPPIQNSYIRTKFSKEEAESK